MHEDPADDPPDFGLRTFGSKRFGKRLEKLSKKTDNIPRRLRLTRLGAVLGPPRAVQGSVSALRATRDQREVRNHPSWLGRAHSAGTAAAVLTTGLTPVYSLASLKCSAVNG
ncbi:hypothetical protein Bbelb_236910 [Branchiostoma belcheri]|nr:hypothetical protein Bbelb_236910 [Branchiostoma belcheri]